LAARAGPEERPEDVVGVEADRRALEPERGPRVADRRRLDRAQARDDADLAEIRGERLRDALRVGEGGGGERRVREVGLRWSNHVRLGEEPASGGRVERREL